MTNQRIIDDFPGFLYVFVFLSAALSSLICYWLVAATPMSTNQSCFNTRGKMLKTTKQINMVVIATDTILGS